jgi:hypothetical protein
LPAYATFQSLLFIWREIALAVGLNQADDPSAQEISGSGRVGKSP